MISQVIIMALFTLQYGVEELEAYVIIFIIFLLWTVISVSKKRIKATARNHFLRLSAQVFCFVLFLFENVYFPLRSLIFRGSGEKSFP